MPDRGLTAGAVVLLAATVSCEAPPDDADVASGVEEEAPLDLSVDRVDVAHGALRMRATMVGGSADVSVLLGDDCDRREVGRGIATAARMAWALAEGELADALRCGLIVRARACGGAGCVSMTAALGVAPDVGPLDSGDGPQLLAVTTAPNALKLAFVSATRNSRLYVGDTRLEPEQVPDVGTKSELAPASAAESGQGAQTPENRWELDLAPGSGAESEQNPENAGEDEAARFVVPYGDFARSILSQRPLVIDGTAFRALVSVGGTALEVIDPTDSLSVESPSVTVTLEQSADLTSGE